jgi:asparagine synthase (glutamine-hydrolysing)
MSGIIGIVNFDGAPIDPDLLSRITDYMAFRGPDARGVWTDASVGLGHTMLRTTWESETEKQPLTLDGNRWLIADARIDARQELIKKLEGKLNRDFTRIPDDAELILHAYEAWGEECVKYLIGDFAFAIWDSRSRQLFCARDHLGIRQLYYAYNGTCFVVSNTLNCLRLHPRVSNKLNEIAIGDFLLFGLNQESSTTVFADINKLPQGHTLVVSRKNLRLKQYWTPSAAPITNRAPADIVEEFLDLLSQSVMDRLRTTGAGISMSGGLDSPAVAAMASKTSVNLRAYCVVYDQVFADDERRYATAVAKALKIPIEFLEGDRINQTTNRRTMGIAPEPFDVEPIFVVSDELLKRIALQHRVALTGWDGDTLMVESPKHSFAASIKGGAITTLVSDLARYVYFTHRPPPIGIRTQLRRWRNPHWNRSPYPAWLNDKFSSRLGLAERWQQVFAERPPAHPLRPIAYHNLCSPSWDSLLSRFDAGETLLPLEVRHPLIDVRVVDYLLSLPIIPWLLNKTILREAMSGILPDVVRQRPKSTLAGDPGLCLRHTKKFQDIDQFEPVEALASYVDRDSIPSVTKEADSNQLWLNLRPFSLNQWLTYSHAMEHANDI